MDRRKFIQATGAATAAAMIAGKKARAERRTVECDLLIIGSGFAGLWAAMTAVDYGVRSVAIVDKGSIGRSSMSRMCAGATIYCLPKDDLDLWLRDYTEAQKFLSRQDIVADIFKTSYSRLTRLESWGIRYNKTPMGTSRLPSRGFKHLKMMVIPSWKNIKGGHAVSQVLLEQVMARKVKMYSKTMITGLLVNNGRVCGAAGFKRITGEPVSFKARAVVLAAADCSFRGNYACVDAATGDGFRVAYDAGVRLNNMEFLCVNTGSPRYGFEGTGVAARYGGKFRNKDMKAFMREYTPDGDKAEVAYIVQAMAEEVEKGNGPPLYLDMSGPPIGIAGGWALGQMGGWVELNLKRLKARGLDIFKSPQEWVPAIQSLRGGVRTDRDCMSDLPGLFAAGMSQSIDPGMFNGWSTMRAMGAGERAGLAAAHFLKDADDVEPDAGAVAEARERAVAGLSRDRGIKPGLVSDHIQEIIFPYTVCVRKSEVGLKQALAKIHALRESEVPAMFAEDPHELAKLHEAENMALTAELFLRASLERRETRSDHLRVEYPETDNRDWLKWVNLRRGEDGAPGIELEDVPLDAYPLKPPATGRV